MSDANPEGTPQGNEPESKAEETPAQQHEDAADDAVEHGRHELPPHQPRPAIGDLQPRGFLGMLRRGRTAFGTLALLLCLLLGVAIATQVRQNNSGDSLDTARPADLLVLLDTLHHVGPAGRQSRHHLLATTKTAPIRSASQVSNRGRTGTP